MDRRQTDRRQRRRRLQKAEGDLPLRAKDDRRETDRRSGVRRDADTFAGQKKRLAATTSSGNPDDSEDPLTGLPTDDDSETLANEGEDVPTDPDLENTDN